MLSKLLNTLGISDSPPPSSSALAKQADELIAAYRREALADETWRRHYNLKEHAAGRQISDAPPELQAQIAVTACDQIKAVVRRMIATPDLYQEATLLQNLASDLLRRKPPLDESQIASLLHTVSGMKWFHWMPWSPCLSAIERYVRDKGVSEQLAANLDDAIKRLTAKSMSADQRKVVQRLTVLREGPTSSVVVQLTRSEKWSAAVLDFLDAAEPARRTLWARLLAHAATSTASKPAKKWLQSAQSVADELSAAEFRVRLVEWFALAEIGGRNERPVPGIDPLPDEHLIMDNVNAQTLKGLVWCATLLGGDDEVVRAIGRLAVACYRKIPWHGARSTAVGNACVWALGAIPGREAVGQLSIVRMKSKYRAAQHGIAKSLTAAAEREGVSPEELEELATPTLGLTEVGRRVDQLGEYRAELVVEDTHTIELKWFSADGKPQKSVPAAVKRDFAEPLKELKAAQKALQKLVPAQRSRIESCYLREKRWAFPVWRERYLDHPLVGTLARRLIWKFTRGSDADKATIGIWHNGALVDSHDAPLKGLGTETQVELWHPAGAPIDEVVAWREWLERHEVTQPFKQAHREIYLLTEAERNTETYSNRFAAHILRQHQFAALCTERGWRYTLQGAWDSSNTPFIDLPHWGIRVEFWVQPIENEERSEMFIYLYLSTDQVRFYRLQEAGPTRLEDVPPLVFSELMRDVDLFVGVSSVGNDPSWADGGPNGAYQAYWQGVSFGDLGATAQTRREVLTRLIPRLAIADRCRLEDKFLVVRGELRSYRIHLGSGNILMTPNNAYLCIVPGQGRSAKGTGRVFLPFEGDNLLSIILSKAILLASDTEITDRSIMSQIKSR